MKVSIHTTVRSTAERAVQIIIEDKLSAKGHTTIKVSHRISQLSEFIWPGRDVVRNWDGKLEGIVSDLKGAAEEILGS